MTQATFYKWVIDCPNNVPQELIDYAFHVNSKTKAELHIKAED